MDFLGIGPWEILLIIILALILVGPEKITGIARTLGRTIRAIKKSGADLSNTVTKELETTQSKLSPPRIKEEKTAEAPLSASEPTIPGHVDQPTKPGGASAIK